MKINKTYPSDISIVIAGSAGSGIQSAGHLITTVLQKAGHTLCASKEYMSRIRGGSNSIQIRVSTEPVAACVDRIDLCLPFDAAALEHLKDRLTDETVVIGEAKVLQSKRVDIDVPFVDYATRIGDSMYLNMIVVGFVAGLFRIEYSFFEDLVTKLFKSKSKAVVDKNRLAAGQGWQNGKALADDKTITIQFTGSDERIAEVLINGSEAIALGALSAGCNFISSYPMSPSTGVLTFMAQHADSFDIVVEQAEDEIAAINMALGSWYAGGRAIVTTSGGGFALMGEALSLAGCIESPLVIHLGQRPGPATGLPTRTEQGDLNLALYAGHGEFGRVILAPGSIEDAFMCAQYAFNLADKYQVPVIILTDQYLLDAYYNIKVFDIDSCTNEYFICESTEGYKRYALTENGISPRAIPGWGNGSVCVDSDEHDEQGRITEDMQTRIAMVDKRLQRCLFLQNDALFPELIGSVKYKTLLVGWGSTYHGIKEALEIIARDDIAFLYFKQVYPIAHNVVDYIERAESVIMIENNATGQFAMLLERELGITIDECILKYDGLPFSVDVLIKQIKKVLAK
jgi:2-oxoglutarate/2-oxoacid ferredoxin oxidoreductase subunit alpha